MLGAALGTAVLTGGLGPGGLGPDLARTLARAVADLAALAVAGAALAAVLAPGRVPGADRVPLVAVPVWFAALLVDAVARGALLAGVPLAAVAAGDVTGYLTGFRAGQGLLLAGVVVLVLAGAVAGRPARPGRGSGPPLLVLALTLAAAAAPAATGHAAASARAVLAVPGVVLHVVAALLWVGGLGAMLVLARDGAVLRSALPRFSRLAAVSIVVLAVSGLLAATARLASPVDVVTTAYGGVVLAKAGLLAGAGALGLLTRRRLQAGRLPVLAWAAAEIVLLAAAVGAAATLTHTA